METFIFNLNKNQKQNKLISDCSAYCSSSDGPYTITFGCASVNSMKSIRNWSNDNNDYYDKCSEILPSNNQTKIYDLLETEVYKIIINL